MKGNNFSVYLDGKLIGQAQDVEDDWPWVKGVFVPTADFEPYRSLFDEEYRCLDQDQSENHATALDRIWDLDFRLESPRFGSARGRKATGPRRDDSIIAVHIHNGQITWRSG